MKIIDINEKEREAESIKVINHETTDKDGNIVNEEFAEVVIKGKNRTWTEWYPLKIFKELNKEVKL